MKTQRLTTSDLVEELRSSLDADSGWIPVIPGAEGLTGLSKDAGLVEVAAALQRFAAAAIPTPVARQLELAAESTSSALDADASGTYGHLGVAYAYVLQARRALLSGSAPPPPKDQQPG